MRLLVPEAWAMAYSRTHGDFPPLAPAERIEALAMSTKERTLYERGLDGHIHGTEDQVAGQLERAIEETGADEVLVTTSTYDRAALVESLRRLARIARPRTGPTGGPHGGALTSDSRRTGHGPLRAPGAALGTDA